MNRENFLKWFEYQLLQKLQNPSLIVLDNAPYHSMLMNKSPTNTWTKGAIQDWLTNQNIPFPKTMFKTELLHIVSQ